MTIGVLLAACWLGSDDGPVFVGIRDAQRESAPPARNAGKLVVLTDLPSGDPWLAPATPWTKGKSAKLLKFKKGDVNSARKALAEELPEFVLVVTKPDHLDVNQHFALLELAASLDDDPFVDFSFGYLTGATAEEATRFAERIVKLEQKKDPLPKKFVDFGPIAQGPPQFGGPVSDPVAKGWKRWNAYHGPLAGLLERREWLSGAGILHAGGHGMPAGIDDGLQGADLRKEKLDFSPALYFSGPCYCGVTSGWFTAGAGGIERREVGAQESFALAAIGCGVSGLFAGFDPDRGETCSQEIEELFTTGCSLGQAAKKTYDGVTVARRGEKLELFRYEQGKPVPHAGIVDTMTGGGACRALFGDPSWSPIEKCADPVFDVKTNDTKKSLELEWACSKPDTTRWDLVDVYHCEGGWTHRIAFKVKIPAATAASLKTFTVQELTADGKPLEHRVPTAMVEKYLGRTFLHVYVVFPPKGQDNVFYKQRDFVARFAFAKK